MIFHRSKAPLRLGFAGGGTDVAPFSDEYGGNILNATINMYAYATIREREDNTIGFELQDKREKYEYKSESALPINGEIDLIKGIYNRVVKDYTHQPLSFDLYTYVDAPPGSGLGTSSTLVVAIIGAFVQWLQLPLGEYDIAQLAYDIERLDLNMAGGKQDQYAATFGGVNFMEFSKDKVIVNPLRIRSDYLNEWAYNTVLFYTETSRSSSDIIKRQQESVKNKDRKRIEAMHRIKQQAVMMKEAVLKGELHKIGKVLDYGWQSKKVMAEGITNPMIDELYDTAIKAGATGGKISGAGGGGFVFFYCPDNTRMNVVNALEKFKGRCRNFEFTTGGLITWTT